MPSTYTVNLGIEKPATGEQSGTWGDTVNDNSNIIDEAVNGVVTITLSSAGSSGSPNQIAITNGASSTGRNKWIEFADGGDLSAAAYVELIPNDAEKICFIRNSLAGSRSVFLFQGTYSTSNDLEVVAGTDVLVKFNGAGTGATVVNVYANLKVDALVASGTVDAGTVEFNSLSGTGSVAVTNILDEDNMASDSATILATQQSIKAYVDSAVDTADTLGEVLAIGNTTSGTDIETTTTDKVQFRDAAIYLNSSADGQLDIVADTEVQIATTTVDLNGALDVSGAVVVAGALTGSSTIQGTTITATTAFVPDAADGAALGTTSLEFSDLYLADGAVIGLGADQDVTLTHIADTGIRLNSTMQLQFSDASQFINAPSGTVLDINATDEVELNATLVDVNANLDVSGTLTQGGASQFNSTIIVGVDNTGYDVKFFGDAASAYMLWDTSADDLILGGGAGLIVPDGQFTLASTAVSSTAAELNILDGVTSTTAELNILDGVTSTTAELNILDGVTSTAAELNILDGATVVVAEVNYLDLGSTAVGTALASKAVILDSNKDYTGVRNLTISGELDAATLDISGAIDVEGTTNLDVVDIDGAVNMATTALVTGVLTTTATQVATGGITSGSNILSDADSTDSLGSTGVRWLKGWFDTLTAGTLTIGSGSVTDSSGAISFGNEDLTTTGKFYFDGGGDTYVFESSANVLDTYTAGNLAQKIDAVGIITQPLQCCFQSTATTQNDVTGDSTDYIITFATTVIDRNADFASPTFTAPVTGQYVLSATVNLDGITAAADYSKMSFVTSNRTYEMIWQDTNDMPSPGHNFTITADMDAADTAHVRILVAGEASDVVDISVYAERTHFSGYLLG